jgi:hypothetical protein
MKRDGFIGLSILSTPFRLNKIGPERIMLFSTKRLIAGRLAVA